MTASPASHDPRSGPTPPAFDTRYYARLRAWAQAPKHASETRTLLEALDARRGARCLDIGCGTGETLRALRSRGLVGLGIDWPLAWAGTGPAGPVARADASLLPFADASFDVVILMHVLAHLADPERALAEAARVLRPRGRLGLITPNRLFTRTLGLVPRALARYRPDPTVRAHFRAAELRQLAVRAGLRVLRAEPLGKRAWLLPLRHFRERLLLVAEPAER